jgi:hypothetical protein
MEVIHDMSRHMRTTVRIPEGLLNQVKQEAEQRGETVTALIEQGLRLVLVQSPARQPREPVKLPVSEAVGGVLPGVDLNDSATLEDIMEGRG